MSGERSLQVQRRRSVQKPEFAFEVKECILLFSCQNIHDQRPCVDDKHTRPDIELIRFLPRAIVRSPNSIMIGPTGGPVIIPTSVCTHCPIPAATLFSEAIRAANSFAAAMLNSSTVTCGRIVGV